MHIWSVANHKGGVGKTTLVVTLGGMLAQSGEPTLLVDLDPNHSLTKFFGYSSSILKNTVYNLFETDTSRDSSEKLSMLIKTRFDQLYLLPASPAMITLEQQLCGVKGLGTILKRFLETLSNSFSYVLIDCPSILGLYVTNAILACQQVIVPVQLDLLSFHGLASMVTTINSINGLQERNTPFTVVPNMVNKRGKIANIMLDRINSVYKINASTNVIPNDSQIDEAGMFGIPLAYYKKEFKNKQIYTDLLIKLKKEHEV